MSKTTYTTNGDADDVGETTTRPLTDDGISLEGLTHAYGETVVYEDVSVGVSPGEVLAIIGPSGVGKTTLLRTLGVAVEPTAGTVRIDGDPVWRGSEKRRLAARRRTGTVFQEANLFDGSVATNVAYGRRIRQPWTLRIRRRIDELLGRRDDTPEAISEALSVVGMADAVDREVGSLSGGEAQRVAFARALAYDPDYLLLDEPTSDLDPHNTAVLEEAVGAAASRDIGVAVATHDMHQARRIADRVAVLLGDSIIELGATDRVFEDPGDPRARKFIEGELVY